MEFERYQCNLVLDGFGFEGQKRLKETGILVIGLGGIGSVVSMYLVANGIGRIGICDYDSVSTNNLTRQILYNTTDVGKNKVEVSHRKLSLLNPQVKIISLPEKIDDKNANEILSQYDFIMECSDSIETKYLINKVCMSLKKKFIISSAIGYKGNVMTVFNNNGACLECIFELAGSAPTISNTLPTCADSGVFPTVPAIVGLLAATKVIQSICHPDNVCCNPTSSCCHSELRESSNVNFITVDLKVYSTRYLKINKNPSCLLHD